MPGCGYTCPACNDQQFLDNGEPCTWCVQEDNKEIIQEEKKEIISEEEWMNQVHNGPCCGDLGSKQESKK